MAHALQSEIDLNYTFFQDFVGSVVDQHRGSYALLRHRKCEGFFRTLRDAIDAAAARFDDELFSIQEVTDRPLDLGFFSHADHQR
jgi:hypothetical protein